MLSLKKIDLIKTILKNEENISFGYLFGSSLTKYFNKNSDIDIALFFKKYELDYELYIIHKIEKELKQKVDLVVLNRVKNIYLLDEILKNSTLLKDSDERFDFEIHKWHEIVDFKDSIKSLNVA